MRFNSNSQVSADQVAAILNQSQGHGVTQRYSPVKTASIIESLQGAGFQVTDIKVTKVRKASKDGFQKHMVRLSHPEMLLNNVGDSRPELVLVNSHDGSTSVKFMIGIFRLVCSNGLIVGQTFEGFNVRHVGDIMPKIGQGLDDIKTRLPLIAASINEMNKRQLSQSEMLDFARRAAALILPEGSQNVDLNSALPLHRSEDQGAALWTVFNRAQEAVIRGGIKYQTTTQDETGSVVSIRNNTSRAVKSIDRQVELNKALWDLAESFKQAA